MIKKPKMGALIRGDLLRLVVALPGVSRCHFSTFCKAVLVLVPLSTTLVHAQVAVSAGGAPTYSKEIAVPPGVAGMSPNLSLSYAGGGVNGPVGHGWSVQGISTITRCPASRPVDGVWGSVTYSGSDKLCLDGQRLIQTDASGAVLAFPQANDAMGLGSGYREFRTEKDIYARVRAYGYANGDESGASGPAYFRVWTKSGQIYDYGASPAADGNTKALISPYGKTVAVAWAVARISDTLGNVIDFKYEQRDVSWGSGPLANNPTNGHEWNLLEVQYSGNKVVFGYADRASYITPRDAAEAYHQGSKNVSIRRLQTITTYVNSPNTTTLGPGANAVAVKTLKLIYDNGPITGRSRVRGIKECAGAPSGSRCLPTESFLYSGGGSEAYEASANFNLGTLTLMNSSGTYGVLTGDFNGDGKTDLIRWSDTPSENQLHLSNGDGSFGQVVNGAGSGQFNITDLNLSHSNGCFVAMVADFNGDGLSDILRYSGSQPVSGNGTCASQQPNYLYLSKGDGSFLRSIVTGVPLKRVSAGFEDYYVNVGYTFYVIDVDNDGKLDIVTANAVFDAQTFGGNWVLRCEQDVCARVFRGDGLGTFVERSTNISQSILYTHPSAHSLGQAENSFDQNGDGLADLVLDGDSVTSPAYLSRGDGYFDFVTGVPVCGTQLDFNGDGRSDCLKTSTSVASNRLQVSSGVGTMTSVWGFNLNTAGKELAGSGIGIQIADFNGDGRSDILRWKDDASQTVVYLGNGDGTFRESTSFNLNTSAQQLSKSDGTAAFITGDFTGRGNVEILRLKQAPAAGASTANQLYVKVDSTPPDLLVAATSATGATTTLYYVPLSNATPSNGVSGAYGPRYTSDRFTANFAHTGKVDVVYPMHVVVTSVVDSGVGNTTRATEYSYFGLKAQLDGRGALGFREVRRQSLGPNGDKLSVFTTYVQEAPYIGMAARTETRWGALNDTSAQLLSRTINVYCDQTATAGAESTANETAPCKTSAKVQRPYLRQSIESGTDLSGAALPQVTTTNSYNGSGDPTTIVVATSGSVAGVNQTFTKTTTNTYDVDNTSCSSDTNCNWILGRLQRASVQSSAPNSFAAIGSGAGSSGNASATAGTGSLASIPMNPAVLAAILQMLLDD